MSDCKRIAREIRRALAYIDAENTAGRTSHVVEAATRLLGVMDRHESEVRHAMAQFGATVREVSTWLAALQDVRGATNALRYAIQTHIDEKRAAAVAEMRQAARQLDRLANQPIKPIIGGTKR